MVASPFSRERRRVRIYSRNWRFQGSNQKNTTMHCADRQELETQRLAFTPVSRDLVETLTLILSLCQRERRATRDERKDPSVDALVRLASLCGERIQVRVILLFENSIGN
jgi:protein-tyrosine-phosphatase